MNQAFARLSGGLLWRCVLRLLHRLLRLRGLRVLHRLLRLYVLWLLHRLLRRCVLRLLYRLLRLCVLLLLYRLLRLRVLWLLHWLRRRCVLRGVIRIRHKQRGSRRAVGQFFQTRVILVVGVTCMRRWMRFITLLLLTGELSRQLGLLSGELCVFIVRLWLRFTVALVLLGGKLTGQLILLEYIGFFIATRRMTLRFTRLLFGHALRWQFNAIGSQFTTGRYPDRVRTRELRTYPFFYLWTRCVARQPEHRGKGGGSRGSLSSALRARSNGARVRHADAASVWLRCSRCAGSMRSDSRSRYRLCGGRTRRRLLILWLRDRAIPGGELFTLASTLRLHLFKMPQRWTSWLALFYRYRRHLLQVSSWLLVRLVV